MPDTTSQAQALVLRAGTTTQTSDFAVIAEAIADEKALVWLDLKGDLDDASTKLLRETFALHPLVIEDMILDYLVPKLEEFPEYIYVLVHSLKFQEALDDFSLSEADLLIGQRWVITH